MNKLRALVDEANAPFVDDEVAIRRARATLLGEQRAKRNPRPRRLFAIAGLLAASATVLLVVRAPWRASAPAISFRIGGSDRVNKQAQVASTDADADVRFSDGSSVMLAPNGKLDVDTTDAGIDVRLHEGKLRAHVVHRARETWQFHSGPFDVLVTGTRFETAWDEARHLFTLTLTEGGVVVNGPLLGAAGQVVRTGETLRIAVADGDVAWDRPSSPPQPIVPAAPPPTVAPAVPATEPAPAAAPRATPARTLERTKLETARPPPAPRVWQTLARADKHEEALGLALSAGYATVLASADATDLLLLADSARLARAPDRARAALRAVRTRFPRSAQAATAWFELGRLAFDVDGNLGEAAVAFQGYLDEAPDGPLAREAAGRLLEARARLGDPQAAAEAARAYLSRFPDGPRAGLARRLLP